MWFRLRLLISNEQKKTPDKDKKETVEITAHNKGKMNATYLRNLNEWIEEQDQRQIAEKAHCWIAEQNHIWFEEKVHRWIAEQGH